MHRFWLWIKKTDYIDRRPICQNLYVGYLKQDTELWLNWQKKICKNIGQLRDWSSVYSRIDPVKKHDISQQKHLNFIYCHCTVKLANKTTKVQESEKFKNNNIKKTLFTQCIRYKNIVRA